MMGQLTRSAVLSLSLLATTMVSSVTTHAADAPSSCLEAFRKADARYMKEAPGLEQTIKSSKVATGVLGGLAIVTPIKLGLAGAVVFGGMGVGGYMINREAKKDLYRLATSSMILSVYEDVLNNSAGDTTIPEGQDLLSQAGIDKQNEQAILAELVKRMESGKLCDKDKSPKDLGDIVAELKDFERTQVRGVY